MDLMYILETIFLATAVLFDSGTVVGTMATFDILASPYRDILANYMFLESQHLSVSRKIRSVNENLQISKALEYLEKETLQQKNDRICELKDLSQFQLRPPQRWQEEFHIQSNLTMSIANTLSYMFLQSSGNRLASFYDDVYFISISRGIIEYNPSFLGFGIAFSDYRGYSLSPFCPYVFRKNSSVYKVVDLFSKVSYATEFDWFDTLSQRKWDRTKLSYSTNFKYEPFNISQTAKMYNLSFTLNQNDTYWSLPYISCHSRSAWTVTHAVPFFDWDNRFKKPVFKGAVVADIDLERFEINQCSYGRELFAGSHRCQRETTYCKHIPGNGFTRGSYQCHCKPGYFMPKNQQFNYFDGSVVEDAYLRYYDSGTNHTSLYMSLNCLPCKYDCSHCNGTECFADTNVFIRGIPLGIQSFCMTITIVLVFCVWHLRKRKVMVISVFCLMEMMLLGSFLLYATVVIQYFEPNRLTCQLIPWCREVGFTILYGALTLKLYRLLTEFQSRKAHRIHVKDKDLLKYLFVGIIIILGFMFSWTAVSLDHSLDTIFTVTTDNLKFKMCRSYWWEYAIECVEIIFLCFATYLSYRTRSAQTDYSEGRYVAVVIFNEITTSTLFYILKHSLWSIHPDYMFLMYFIRCQLTVTVTLVLIFGPKIWFAVRPTEGDRQRSRAYSTGDAHGVMPEMLKLNLVISPSGEVDVGEIDLNEINPEDIRLELKRLYTKLQVFRMKMMRRDNPHISKRRGGRKHTHRRFSIQPFHHKHRHHQQKAHPEQETEISKTPEDSVVSADVTVTMNETNTSRFDEPECHMTDRPSTHNLTFKSLPQYSV